MKILVVGGTGFIGTALVEKLITLGHHSIRISARRIQENLFKGSSVEWMEGDFSSEINWKNTVADCDVIIHLAAKAHVIEKENPRISEKEFKRINIDSVLRLAKCAIETGVKRFIFLSSIGVNGSYNVSPFTETDEPNPQGFYAKSKWEAEVGLRDIAKKTNMHFVIIRPPLVYGPSAPGNFGKLAKLTSKNFPLPFGAIHNRRSLVSLDNLVDLIITCVEHPNAENQTFLVGDDHDISTTELLSSMRIAVGKRPMLVPIPMGALRLVARLTGKLAVIDKLCGNLQVDISYTKDILGWKPPVSFKYGIQKCFNKE